MDQTARSQNSLLGSPNSVPASRLNPTTDSNSNSQNSQSNNTSGGIPGSPVESTSTSGKMEGSWDNLAARPPVMPVENNVPTVNAASVLPSPSLDSRQPEVSTEQPQVNTNPSSQGSPVQKLLNAEASERTFSDTANFGKTEMDTKKDDDFDFSQIKHSTLGLIIGAPAGGLIAFILGLVLGNTSIAGWGFLVGTIAGYGIGVMLEKGR